MQLAGQDSMDAVRAVFALAKGDQQEASRLLGSPQERRDSILKKLIGEAKLGEPCREAQPGDDDLSAASAAKRNSVFPKAEVPTASEVIKSHGRPLVWILTTGIKKLWSYLLHGLASTADCLNLLCFHCGSVAADRRYQAQAGGYASERYFWWSLEVAWRESRRAE
jgi:hypothetical protein